MTKLTQILELFENSDRIQVIQAGKQVCHGHKANICGAHGSRNHLGDYGLTGHEIVHKIRPHSEYRRQDWQERGMAAPLMPEETPDYIFRDLQETFYFEILI